MKFGTAEGNAHPGIFRGFWPQKMRKIAKISNFLQSGNPLPDFDEIRRVYAGNRSTKAVNIWCDLVSKLGIYRQKFS